MSKGYDSAERETRERLSAPKLCEAYACLEPAALRFHNHDYCEAHRPNEAALAEPGRAPSS